MTLVVDASAATALCLAADGFDLVAEDLVAPVLLRSEVLSALRGLEWRREISSDLANLAVGRLLGNSVRLVSRKRVWAEARVLATRLGWAKTYDAEYVALARLEGCPVLTLDVKLARRVESLVEIRFPDGASV